MKNVLTAILLTALIASCSSSTGSDDSNTRFGTWEKVSAQQGNYIGLQGHHSKVISYKRKADTTAIDTSFINSTSRLSMEIEPVTLNNDYTFALTITDYSRSFNYTNSSAEYTSDSTAIKFQNANGYTNDLDYSDVELWFTNGCNDIQDKNEFVNVTVYGKNDSSYTGRREVFKIYVNGMKDIAKDLVASCN